MIEKFNFYDIYGYFLPGLALVGVFWLPFGLGGHVRNSSGWSSAIIVGAAAYILGHLLQAVASTDLPSKIEDSKGDLRYPSDIALDSDSELSPELREKIGTIAREQFGIDVHVNEVANGEMDKRRNAAFFFARQALIREKAISYAEQFQGMYALTRGLSVVFALGSSYWLGWAASYFRQRYLVAFDIILLTLALLLLINDSVQRVFARRSILKRASRWMFLLLSLTIGYAAGMRYIMTPVYAGSQCLLAGLGLLASLRIYNAYKYFAGRFAITVWRDFLAYQTQPHGTSAAAREIDH